MILTEYREEKDFATSYVRGISNWDSVRNVNHANNVDQGSTPPRETIVTEPTVVTSNAREVTSNVTESTVTSSKERSTTKEKTATRISANKVARGDNTESHPPTKLCMDMFWAGMEPLSQQSNDTLAWISNQCDNLLCNSTLNGICQWSFLAIDSLLESSNSFCNADRVEEFFMDADWNDYRVSDFLKGRMAHEVKDMPSRYPGSLIAEIHEGMKKGTSIARVVASRIQRTPLGKRTPPSTLVVHLRLGDVVDGAVDPVRDLLFEPKFYFRRCQNETKRFCEKPWLLSYNLPSPKDWNRYVMPLSYFSSRPDIDKYKSVVIIGSAHQADYKREAIKSCQYTSALVQYFKRRMPHATISLRLGQPPDDDILFAGLAAGYIRSGGGFSGELGKLNKLLKMDRFTNALAPEAYIATTQDEATLAASDLASKSKKCRQLFMSGIEPLSRQSRSNGAWTSNKCDSILCNSTVSDSCQWSHFAIDTLLENATYVCSPAHVEAFYSDPYWDEYRFSDAIKGGQFDEFRGNATRFPGSLLAELEKARKSGQNDWKNIGVAKYIARAPIEARPTQDTLVIHMKLGGLIDGAVDKVRDLLFEQKYYSQSHNLTSEIPVDGTRDVRPLSYYSSMEDFGGFKKVVIMGAAAHADFPGEKSCHYATALQAYFQRRIPRASVSLRVGRSPDEEVVFAALAPRFIQAGGDFSEELAKLNQQMRKPRYKALLSSQ